MVEWRGERLICSPVPCVDFRVALRKYLQKEGGYHLPSALVLEQPGLQVLPLASSLDQACLSALASIVTHQNAHGPRCSLPFFFIK